ncbi:MAG: heme oxygenase [Piccolia ochrophora]|nr:MAG: heme oxygenase [Piccolia ochrophora]
MSTPSDPAMPLLSPSQSPVDTPKTLPEEINSATRSIHARINRLLTARLPLALPPHTKDPSVYLLGLAQIEPIYRTLESTWASLLLPSTSPPLKPRHDTILRTLHLPSLLRTASLVTDLAHPSRPPITPINTPPRLAAFLSHITTTLSTSPHLILAYTWILYMALFSGGRWMRAQLLAAGPDFWTPSTVPLRSKTLPTRHDVAAFFHFAGDHDGEDIKEAFKASVASVEHSLTTQERAEIVSEAGRIFAFLVDIVGEIDELVACSSALHAPSTKPGVFFGAAPAGAKKPSSSSWEDLLTTRIQRSRLVVSLSLVCALFGGYVVGTSLVHAVFR